ncbi:hypothetical protein C8A00DRAFT_33753 [Chaetomidium leptoderma]|uniref:Uncharacterized protein n=1 Tax=Chaetomidium leptoderma TaxID=669021 RepID=A0AAN6VLI9_9PEZI|nr:hypothetical protein C8A00DRAFT_33753 [Chaetomidium leptoderma]
MPTYHTPPQTPSSPPFPSRSTSFSHSSSSSTGRSSNTSGRSRSKPSVDFGLSKDEKKAEAKKKIPYVFLGTVAAASLLAHKCWPKGFVHGDKEDWELSGLELRAKQRRLAEKAEKAARRIGGGGGERRGSRGGGVGHHHDHDDDYGFDDRYRDGRREYYLGKGTEYEHVVIDDGRQDPRWDRERGPRERPQGSLVSRGRGRSRDRAFEANRYPEPSSPYRRATTSRERTDLRTTTERYYPPRSKALSLGTEYFQHWVI